MSAKTIDAMSYGIGLTPRFFERNTATGKFPPHNITQIGEDKYRLTLAVAGFTRDDLTITLQGEHLLIRGSKCLPPMEPEHKVLYRGIAYRDFSREFMIGDHVQIETAKLQHGLLEIDLIRHLPEIQKLREIPITA